MHNLCPSRRVLPARRDGKNTVESTLILWRLSDISVTNDRRPVPVILGTGL
ncbi:MAG: hypothetical protein JWN00_3022 [Actinomycetia bacterium]|nr:hypothetical protein [Actinomycetes bacterium]